MSSEGGLPLPLGFEDTTLDSPTSCTPLHKFAWDVKHCGLFPAALQAIPTRAVLSVWVDELEIRARGEEGSLGASSADEDKLDWLVLSVESGWTPRRVLPWLFPDFGFILFNIITSEASMV
jgi:hypothetical protein